MKILFYTPFLLFLIACTDDSNHDSSLPDIEGYVSIVEGVYGQVSYFDDVGDQDPLVLEDFKIHIFDLPFSSSDFATSTPLISTSSNGVGFYEIPLQPREYCICTDFGRCAGVNLEENALIRIDYEMSEGPGWQTSTLCE